MSATCPNCGRALAPSAAFCPNCGVKTGEAGEEAAALAADLAGLDVLSPSLSPDVLGELTEKFFSAADEIAKERGGTVTREGPSTVTIKFPRDLESPAATAASCALVLRDATRSLRATSPKDLSTHAYLTVGVDATPPETEPADEPSSPRAKAEKLRRKAGKWLILAGEDVHDLTAGDFKYVPVGFYQTRGSKPAVKIYELKEDRRYPTSAPPVQTSPFVAVAGFEEAIENSFAAVLSIKRRRTVFVTGAAGTGKTTWLTVACRAARLNGFRVYASSCMERRRYAPFALWVPIWREAFADLAPEVPPSKAAAQALRKIGERLEIWAPLFSRVLGFRAEPDPHVADVTPEFRHRRIIDITKKLLLGTAADKPTALVLDDIHFADASSRALLGSLLAAPADAPLALVVASETSDDTIERAADAILSTRPFTENEVAAFAANFADADGEEAAAQLYAEGKGHPEILQQAWLATREKPDLNIKSLAAGGELEGPALVARRLRDFDKRWQNATAALLMLGVPVRDRDLRFLAADAFGADGTAAEAWRYKLYKLDLLRPALGEEESLCVPSHLAPAVLAAAAPTPGSRATAARTAAAFLAERYPRELPARVALELAAGKAQPAYELALENAEQARWLGSPHDAVAQLTAVIHELERTTSQEESGLKLLPRLYLTRAEAFYEAGLAAAALNDLEKIGTEEGELAARRFYTQGRVYLRRSYFPEAETAFLETLQFAARLKDYGLVADVELALADLFLQQGEATKATYELEKSLKADRVSSPRAFELLADLKYRHGYVADALQAAQRSLSSADAERKPITAAEAALSLAPIFFEYGRVTSARSLIAKAREAFAVVGDGRGHCKAYVLEGTIDLATEDLATSGTTFGEALRLAEDEGFDSYGVEAALGLSVVRLFQNDPAAHRRFLVKAKEATAGDTRSPQPGIDLAEAAACFAAGDYHNAYRLADAATGACRRAGNAFSYGSAAVLAARAALAAGKREKCREVLAQPDLDRRARESKVFFASYNLAAGELFAAEADLERARKYLAASAAAARELGLWLVRSECYLKLADVAPHDNEREKYRRRALWLLEKKGATFLAGKVREEIGL
jgi:class 3 adenylate cyclase